MGMGGGGRARLVGRHNDKPPLEIKHHKQEPPQQKGHQLL